MSIVMKVYGLDPAGGHYLKSFDFEASEGTGLAEFTTEWQDALQFLSVVDALTFRDTQSTTKPLRPDGEPNRPLTAATWEFILVP
jgi:hypothetical protein